ncbi:uncharacterized protein M6G45_003629 [Spheniscus humboldti]
MALQHCWQVLHGPAALSVGPAWRCSTGCESCVALQRWVLVLHGLQHWVPVLHGPAVLGASAAQSCSTICKSCMALQHRVQVLHGPAALGPSLARPCGTVCRFCMALQCRVRILRGPAGKPCTALQRQVQAIGSPAAPGANPAWPCGIVGEPCTALQQCLQVLHGPAAPGGRLAQPCSRVWEGSRRAPLRRTGLAQPCSASLRPSRPRSAFREPGPSRLCSAGCPPGAASARPRRLRHPPQAPTAGTPRPVPEPVLAGSRFPSRHNWKGAGAAPGSARWCRGHVSSSAAAAGGGGDRGDAWGKSSVFNVPDSHLFLKQTDKFCCTALDEKVKTKKKPKFLKIHRGSR